MSQTKMPIFPIAEPSITQKEIDYVTNAVRSGWVSSLGTYIEQFESLCAKFVGCEYAISTSNATTGLHLALRSLGIGPGDEVIVPDLSFIATANAVTHCGAKPVFADILPTTLTLDPKSIEKQLTPKTRAIIPVHLYGYPAEMERILEIAAKKKLFVVEDAAESIGAEIQGNRVGSFGDFGVFSFYGNKIVTTGEGGILTTNNPTLAKKARDLRDHAMSPDIKYWHTEVGFNYRLTNIQAALGVAQMERIEEILNKKDKILSWYNKGLASLPQLRLKHTHSPIKSVCWMVCIENDEFDFQKRSEFMLQLKNRGVETRPYFFPMSDMPMYQKANTPVAHKISPIGFNLPSSVRLTEADVAQICEIVIDVTSEFSRVPKAA